MEHHAIGQQVLVEHQTLAYITSALRATIGWKFQGSDLTRKLTSLRFVGESFERHLEHLMGLEEADGYMAVVFESRPELSDAAVALRQEHDQFREELSSILARLRGVGPTDHDSFTNVSHDLVAMLERVDEHSKKETELLQEVLLRDEGGEG